MKKFSGILICTDLDGTLLRKNKTISDENMEAINYFMAEGGLFTFVTGRMPNYVKDMYERVNPNAPFGCSNGGALFDHKKQEYLWKRPISSEVLELVEYVDHELPQVGIQVCTFEKTYFCKSNPAIEEFIKITGLPKVTADYHDVKEEIAKIIFTDLNEETIFRLKELLDEHPKAENFDFVRSERILYEILPKYTHKGTVIEKMCELFNLDIKNTIGIGDYDNDIGMLKTAGLGIAVANASDSAKAVADMITVSNEEHAIAQVIKDLDSGKIIL